MVFPGHFSRGCLLCRKRKVKCDESTPGCHRCKTYGQTCPGYTDEFRFHYSGQSKSLAVEKVSKRKPGDRGLWQTIDLPHDQTFLCFFMHRFTSPDEDDGFPGHLSSLSRLYNHSQAGLLETATLSVAYMAAFQQSKLTKHRVESYANLGRSIKLLREVFDSGEGVTDDQVLIAILLLCMHKDISGDSWDDPREHASGLFYLLGRRGVEQFATKAGVELFGMATMRLLLYSFLYGDDIYNDLGSLGSIVADYDPFMHGRVIAFRTMSLRHRLLRSMGLQHTRISPINQSKEDRESLVGECYELLDDFNTWEARAAPFWQSTFSARSIPLPVGKVSLSKTHYDPETACIVILIRGQRLILLLTLLLNAGYEKTHHLEKGKYDEAAFAAVVSMLREDVHNSIEDILKVAPYALGMLGADGRQPAKPYDGAGALVILFSIKHIPECAVITTDQAKRVNDLLKRMAEIVGIGAADRFARSGPVSKIWMEEQSLLKEYLRNGVLP